MKMKTFIRKGFTLIEIAVTMAVVAILSGVSVGLYFGLSNNQPEQEAVDTRQSVIDLWGGYLNNGLDFSGGLEAKANDFATKYIKNKGLDVLLNYRVMQFDDYVSTIRPESPSGKFIQKAIDPNANNKQAVIFTVETEYPSYFISTPSSVIFESEVFQSMTILTNALIDDVYVKESGLLETYGINTENLDFSDFFELDDIQTQDGIVRGVRYVRYNVAADDGETYYATLYARENRTLEQECSGLYHPKYVQVAVGTTSIILNDKFRMYETAEDSNYYNYDPNHLYEFESCTYDPSLETYDVLDLDGNVINTNVHAPISSANSQFVVDSKDIFYQSELIPNGSGSTTPGDYKDENGNIIIGTPVNPNFPNPDDDENNGGASSDNNVSVSEYPIALYFTKEVDMEVTGFLTWLLKVFGIKETKFQYLYFNNLKTVNEFINYPGFKNLLEDDNQITYLHLVGNLEVDFNLNIPENFIIFLDHVQYGDNTARKEGIKTFTKERSNTGVDSLDDKNHGTNNVPAYTVKWGSQTSSLTIKKGSSITLRDFSYLYQEADLNPTTPNKGYEVASYNLIQNEGRITFNNNSGGRFLGLVKGNGKIEAKLGSKISEPFKVTDDIQQLNTENKYSKRGIFPYDIYYLDSIRCNLEIYYGAIYMGLFGIQRSNIFTGRENIELVTKNTSEAIFTLKSEGVFIKNCNDAGKTTLKLVSGLCEYNSAEIAIKHGTISSLEPFNTVKTGFKLSNMDFIIESEGILNMSDYEKSGGEWHSGRIEILPNSSFINHGTVTTTALENGTQKDKYNKIVIDNYFANSTVFNNYINNGGDATKLNKLKSIFDNNKDPMFYNDGTIDITANFDASTRETFDGATKTLYCGCGDIAGVSNGHKHCAQRKVVTDKTIMYDKSSVFCWGIEKIIDTKKTNGGSLTLTVNDKVTVEHHERTLCCTTWFFGTLEWYLDEYTVTTHTIHKYQFKVGGSDSCVDFPLYRLY